MASGMDTIAEERRLIALCAAGDEGAWNSLLREYGPFLYGAVTGHTANRGEIREIFLHIIEQLWKDGARRLTAWEGRSRLSTYLVSIASRLCMDYCKGKLYREGTKYVALDEPAMRGALDKSSAAPASPHRYVSHKECAALLEELLGQLPEKDRTVLTLFYWQGMKYTEIASLAKMSVAEVGRRLLRGRKKLKRLLAARGITDRADLME